MIQLIFTNLFLLSSVFIFRFRDLRLPLFWFIAYSLRCFASIGYFLYTQFQQADAQLYTDTTFLLSNEFLFSPGTDFILILHKFLANFFFFKRESFYSLYFVLSCIAFTLFVRTLERISSLSVKDFPQYFKFLLLLPSFAFWTVAPSKDCISFLAFSLFLFSIFNFRSFRNFLLLIASSVLIYLVRPQLFYLFIVSFVYSLVLPRTLMRINPFRIVLALCLAALFIYLFFTYGLDYLSLSLTDTESVLNYTERFTVTADADKSLNNYFARLVFYLLTPLPFITSSPFVLLELIQTVVLIPLYFIFMSRLSKIFSSISLRPFVLYVFFSVSALSFITFNTGVSSRQRWLILPFMILLSLATSSLTRKSSNSNLMRT